MKLTRRGALRGAVAFGAAASAEGLFGSLRSARAEDVPEYGTEFPAHSPDVVRELVGACHARLDRVKELVAERPALAKASWDWGFGDWESALGAASHMGRRDIAEFLLEHGARPTLFSAAMLGQLSVVQAFVEASPGIQGTPGPSVAASACRVSSRPSATTRSGPAERSMSGSGSGFRRETPPS